MKNDVIKDHTSNENVFSGNPPLTGEPNNDPIRSSVPPPPRPKKTLRRFVFWVIFALVFGVAMIVLGAYLGAHGKDKWYTEAVLWIVYIFQ
jgi:hypothetical protein